MSKPVIYPANQHTAALVKKARLEHGYSRKSLADRVGGSDSNIAKIEAGSRGLTDEMACRLNKAFGSDVFPKATGNGAGEVEQTKFPVSGGAVNRLRSLDWGRNEAEAVGVLVAINSAGQLVEVIDLPDYQLERLTAVVKALR